MGFLLLGIDSLIACAAVGALVDKRSRVWLAGLFGLADGVAFLIGAGLGWTLLSQAASDVVQLATFVALGLYLLVVAVGTAQIAAHRLVWVLPFALIADNLTYGIAGEHDGAVLGQAAVQTASSGLLALAGLLLAVWLPRALPVLRHVAATRVAGAGLLVAAGALFLVG
jgi:hypothetical protein